MVEPHVVAEQVAQNREDGLVVEQAAEPGVPPQELIPEPLAPDAWTGRHQPLGVDHGLQVLDVALLEHAVEHQVAIEVEEVPLLGGQAVSHPPIVSERQRANQCESAPSP